MRMLYKENWQEARRRWIAFWKGEIIDRPCIIITAPVYPKASYRKVKGCAFPIKEEFIVPEPKNPFIKWTNVDYLIKQHEAMYHSNHYLGEAIPNVVIQMGWCACYGGPIEYRPDSIWLKPFIKSWEKTPDWEKDWDDWGWRHLKKATKAVVKAFAGKCFVGTPSTLHFAPNDMLSMMRGSGRFLMDLLEYPEEVKYALKKMRQNSLQIWNELQDIRLEKLEGYANYWPIWCREKLSLTQSDLSCMISPKMYEEFILPEVEELSSAMDYFMYHLDGPGAIKHVDMICELPKVTLIQWVPGAGQPTGAYWMNLYKRIQAKGKAVYAGIDKKDLEVMIKELDPKRLLLSMRAESIDEAKEILKKATLWTSRYHGRNLSR